MHQHRTHPRLPLHTYLLVHHRFRPPHSLSPPAVRAPSNLHSILSLIHRSHSFRAPAVLGNLNSRASLASSKADRVTTHNSDQDPSKTVLPGKMRLFLPTRALGSSLEDRVARTFPDNKDSNPAAPDQAPNSRFSRVRATRSFQADQEDLAGQVVRFPLVRDKPAPDCSFRTTTNLPIGVSAHHPWDPVDPSPVDDPTALGRTHGGQG